MKMCSKKKIYMSLAMITIIIALFNIVYAANSGIQSREAQNTTSNRFLLQLGDINAYFSDVEGLESLTEVIEYQDGDDIYLRKRSGRVKYSNLILKREAAVNIDFAAWYSVVQAGRTNYRKDGFLTLYDKNGQMIGKWEIKSVWPCGLGYEADKNDNDKYIEKVTLAVEGISRVSTDNTKK